MSIADDFFSGLKIRVSRDYTTGGSGELPADDGDGEALAKKVISWQRADAPFAYPGYLRSSSLYDVCLREQVLGFLEGASASAKHPVGLTATFEIGHAVHFWLQNQYHFFGERLLGWWECTACGARKFGRKPLHRCLRCGALPYAFRYTEHGIKLSEPYRATGHVDLFVEISGDLPRICDIKTIDGKRFSALEGPLVEHVYQVTDYLILMDYDTAFPIKVSTEEAIVLYISKTHQSRSFPAKAYYVRRRPEVEAWIRSVRRRFTQAVTERVPPEPLEECVLTAFEGARARRCPLQALCKERTADG